MTWPSRVETLEMLRRIKDSPLGDRLILAGSSGVYGVSETIPALTEDIDVLIDADWLAAHEGMVLEQMRQLGFQHQPGTPTFTSPAGLSLDLVGYSRRDVADRIGGGKALPVMVFADLSRLLSLPQSIRELPSGGSTLSPATLAAAKLLTVRLEKGSKDKLQALLVIAENAGDEDFLRQLRALMGAFPPDRVEDAIADAHAALLAVSADVAVAGPQAAGYAGMLAELEQGLILLQRLAGPAEARS
ncbi:MAG TPA: hypothetical protein VMW75_20855 [Thermoanaerobaculia bacterium]|nr:hypothetical protein [Thermoanaerobaculia bacterium]